MEMENSPKTFIINDFSEDIRLIFKYFLDELEDLKEKQEQSILNLYMDLPKEHAHLVKYLNVLDDVEFQKIRKRILDLGNGAIRNFSKKFENCTISFDFNQ